MINPTLSILTSVLLQATTDIANRFNGYLILGYLAMWLIGALYIYSLVSRQRNIQQDIELLQQLLQEDEQSDE